MLLHVNENITGVTAQWFSLRF